MAVSVACSASILRQLFKAKFQSALANYDEQSWQHLKRIRAIVGGAKWFTSEPAYRALTEFVDGWLIHEIDMELMKRRRSGERANWEDFNRWLYSESRNKTDALLVILAEDFGLAPDTVASAASGRTGELMTQDSSSRSVGDT